MNLFWIHPRVYPDPLLRKIIVEIAQQLCTAARHHLHYHGRTCKGVPKFYKVTHPMHPCVVWCARSRRHFRAACGLGLLLCAEFRRRRHNKVHRTEALLVELWRHPPPRPARSSRPRYANKPRFGRIRGLRLRVPLAMDSWCHDRDAVKAYRTWVAHKLSTNRHQRFFHGSKARARHLFDTLCAEGLKSGVCLEWREAA